MNTYSVYSLIDKFVLDQQRFNATYWPYTIKVETYEVFDAERWCYQHFKSRNWRNKGTAFAFKQEKDYMLFTLRWS